MPLLYYICLQDTVLECTQNFVLISGMVRLADQKLPAIETIVCYSHFLKGGAMPQYAGLHREAPVSVGRQKEQEGNMSKKLCCGFCKKAWVRSGQLLGRFRIG